MIKLDVQVQFAEILVKFKEKKADASDFGKLIQIVRENKKEIPDKNKIQILNISKYVLKERCKLNCNEYEWANAQGQYFADNCIGIKEWKEKFESKCFSINDINKFMEYIFADTDRLNSDFYLRNPEVIMKENVQLIDQEWYRDEQIIYAMVLEDALMK